MTEDGSQGVAATGLVAIGNGPIRVFDPTHPDADASGFVAYPDVDIAAQMADLMGASRSYSMNATVTQAAKQSALDAIELGR
jgi:flagellar basal-body rod protein FlgC